MVGLISDKLKRVMALRRISVFVEGLSCRPDKETRHSDIPPAVLASSSVTVDSISKSLVTSDGDLNPTFLVEFG